MNLREMHDWVNQPREAMIITEYNTVNRSQRRSMEAEVSKIGMELLDVEKRFLQDLFDESLPHRLTYNDFYTYYLDQWKNNISAIKRLYKPKWCIVNEHYFEKTYKSIV